MTVCAGVSDVRTSDPTALSLIALTNSLATGSATSASSSATRTSRNTAATSDSESRPRLASLSKIAPKRSPRASSIASLRWVLGGVHGLDLRDGVADGLDLLGLFVRDVDGELGLERHHELDLIEGVRAEVVGDRRFGRDFVLLDAELLDDDLLDAFEGVSGHGSRVLLVSAKKATSGSRRRPPAFGR